MIKFEFCKGEVLSAVFSGKINEMLADLCVEITLMYGALKNQNAEAANEFKRNLSLAIIDEEMRNRIFSSDLYDSMLRSGMYNSGTASVANDMDENDVNDLIKRLLGALNDEDK